jgi:hypothetical protein
MLCLWLAGSNTDSPLTLPLDRRPEWLQRDGVVMVGSWEPLLFRVRRDGSDGYTPTAQQRADYDREHSPEMIAEFKKLGVNFVMMHAYKGFGLLAERESMEDAANFAKLCRQSGLHVGVYASSGTLGWELFFKEQPQAKSWILLNEKGGPIPYGSAKYRYYFNRQHPELVKYQQDLIRFAVENIQADLLHFDNYCIGPGTDPESVRSFRDYLRRTLAPSQLDQMGIDLETVKPPTSESPDGPLKYCWRDFSCQWLADSYCDLSRYARSLRNDILMECNPGGVLSRIEPPMDHGRLLSGGEAFWDEGTEPGYRENKLHSRIRTYKVGRMMKNAVFSYTRTPLEAAESMAFNLNCLGCIGWFEYGKLVAYPGSTEPISKELTPYTHFFNTRRDLFQNTQVLADVAVWRSFASQVFADRSSAQLTSDVEERLIQERIPFQIIYDPQLKDLNRYQALILAGCVAVSDAQLEYLREYVRSGGHLCMIGDVATHDQWMNLRKSNPFADFPSDQLVRIEPANDWLAAVRQDCGGEWTISVNAKPGVCMEVLAQPNRRLVHLVNYRSDGTANDIAVRLKLPQATIVRNVVLTSPEGKDDMELAFTQKEGSVAFTVPTLKTYEIAIVNTR